MGDPITSAIVEKVVDITFGEFIKAAKEAFTVKKSCKTLKEKVAEIVPLLEAARQNSTNWSQAHLEWLKDFETLLSDAESIVHECLQESRRSKWKRLMRVWQWRKLPSRIKDMNEQIETAKSNVNLTILGVIQTLNSTPKAMEAEVEFVPQPLPPLIVGQGEKFTKLKSSILASHAKDKPSYIGVHGRGGAGKTVIAKQLHNDEDIQAKYGKQDIWWITVGLDARICDLYKTMGSFLNDGVFEKKYAQRNQEDQRFYLLNVMAKKKVFLIFDDVWDKCDDKAMIDWLNIATAPGSTTLITTRSTTVLSIFQAETKAILRLSEEDSWTLFRSQAFQGGSLPSDILKPLAREVCKECQGLPLALKVIGRTMADKTTLAEWNCVLRALQQSELILDTCIDSDLYRRLQLSYDDITNDVTKICFLYCAAFPEDKKIPIEHLCQIWIGEGLFGNLDEKDAKHAAMAHIQMLTKRSMVDMNDNHILVHDILRDLAMYIINTAQPGDCAYQCYFQVKKVWETIPYSQVKENVQRISFMQSTISKWPESLEAPNLRVCILSEMSTLERKLDIPTEFFSKMQALQYLDLSGNYFGKLQLSSLKGLSTLHILRVQNCETLFRLPDSIGNLTSLTKLSLRKCRYLWELPKAIEELKSLTELDLEQCESLQELPESISDLTSLTKLNLLNCSSLKVLPKNIRCWKSLTKSPFYGCRSLRELPESINELTSLTNLRVGCKSLKVLPKSIGGLKSLTALGLGKCESLPELPEDIGELTSLTTLNLFECSSLKVLPKSIEGLKSLTELDLGKCESLTELPEDIGELTSLTTLNLLGCKSLNVLPKNIGGLKSLTELDLELCESLTELPEDIDELTSLTTLNLLECSSLKVLPKSIGGLKSLTMLDLGKCQSLTELPEDIGELTSLTTLNLLECSSLKVLPKSIEGLKSLTMLDLGKCESLTNLPESMDKLTALTYLNLSDCTSLEVFPSSIGKLKGIGKHRNRLPERGVCCQCSQVTCG